MRANRGQYLSAARHTDRPVGEAVGVVTRTNDQPGADDERIFGENFLHGFFAQGLERTVSFSNNLFDGFIFYGAEGVIFVDADCVEIGVDRDGGNEHVL